MCDFAVLTSMEDGTCSKQAYSSSSSSADANRGGGAKSDDGTYDERETRQAQELEASLEEVLERRNATKLQCQRALVLTENGGSPFIISPMACRCCCRSFFWIPIVCVDSPEQSNHDAPH